MVAFALLASLLAASQHVPPSVVYSPPAPLAPAARQPQLIVLRSGAVECSGIVVEPVRREMPIPEARDYVSPSEMQPITLHFTIDAAGRPIDIDGGGTPFWPSADAVPAFAAWQFASSAPKNGCSMTYTVNHPEGPDVLIEDAERAFAFRRGDERAMMPFYVRTIPAASDCFDPFPAYRLQAYPDYEALGQTPGRARNAMIGFDVDAKGRTRNLRVIGGDRGSAIAAAGLKAVHGSRFVPGARHGCALPFSVLPRKPLEAPSGPPAGDYEAADAACEGAPQDWVSMPPLAFPSEFARRSIEGWAVVRFDVAPWGEIGNVSVVKAEPAAAFGEAAKGIVMRAKKTPSTRGFSGCVQRVNFKIRPWGTAPDTPPASIVR